MITDKFSLTILTRHANIHAGMVLNYRIRVAKKESSLPAIETDYSGGAATFGKCPTPSLNVDYSFRRDIQHFQNGRKFVDPEYEQKIAEYVVQRVQPSLDNVLYSLYMDAQAGAMSFSEFCSDFGYDNDSISALNTYRACEKIAENFLPMIRDCRKEFEKFAENM